VAKITELKKRVPKVRFVKTLTIILLAIVILVFMLTACRDTENSKEADVTITFSNATDYDITGFAFQIFSGYRMNNPMRGPDELDVPLVPGESRDITFSVPKNNLDGEWLARLSIAGEESYFQDEESTICFDGIKLIVITCDDAKNFRFTPYLENPSIPNGSSDDIGGGSNGNPDDVGGGDVGGGLVTAGIILDFSCGSPEAVVRQETLNIYGEITLTELSENLSWYSALDFDVSFEFNTDGGITVDWKPSSSLVSGSPPDDYEKRLGYLDEEKTGDLRFYDADTLRWFMMDSMYQTLIENHYYGDIYYTMDGGKKLELAGLEPISVFPISMPYMGSAYYFAHADVRGESWISEEEALEVLAEALAPLPDGTAIISRGSDLVYNEYLDEHIDVYVFAYGANRDDQFVAEIFYAFTKDGEAIFRYDIENGELIAIQ
jgi:hypothetical protein